MQYKPELPNSTLALVLGILSLATCFCYGFLGLPLAIVAYVLGKNGMRTFHASPDQYKGYDNAKAGYVLGIIGIILNAILLFFVLLMFVFSLSVPFLPYLD